MRKYSFARLTTEDGDFNGICTVHFAKKLLAKGLLVSFDGKVEQSDSWEWCYTVADERADELCKMEGVS